MWTPPTSAAPCGGGSAPRRASCARAAASRRRRRREWASASRWTLSHGPDRHRHPRLAHPCASRARAGPRMNQLLLWIREHKLSTAGLVLVILGCVALVNLSKRVHHLKPRASASASAAATTSGTPTATGT